MDASLLVTAILVAAGAACAAGEICFRVGRSAEQERIAYRLSVADVNADPYKVADAIGLPREKLESMYPRPAFGPAAAK